MIERAVELVDGVRPERVAHLGPVEGDPDHRRRHRAVVGDVGELERIDHLPLLGVKRTVSLGQAGHGPKLVRSCRHHADARWLSANELITPETVTTPPEWSSVPRR